MSLMEFNGKPLKISPTHDLNTLAGELRAKRSELDFETIARSKLPKRSLLQ